MRVCVCICACACMHVYVRACVCVCVCVFARMQSCVCMYACMHVCDRERESKRKRRKFHFTTVKRISDKNKERISTGYSIDHSHKQGVSLVQVSPLADWVVSGCRSTEVSAQSFHLMNINF